MSMSSDNILHRILYQCGFEGTPGRVLAQLLSRGTTSASILARRTGIKRPTVYAVLENLISLGLVQKSRKQKTTFFSVVSAKVFSDQILDRAQVHFENVKDGAQRLQQHLAALPDLSSIDFGGYELSIIENGEEFYRELELALGGGSYTGIFNPQVAVTGIARPMVERFLRQTGEKHCPIREIMVAGPEGEWYKGKIRNPNHEVRELAPQAAFTTDMIFYNGVVILAHYGSNREFAIKIRHKEYYRSMLALFESLWATLPESSLK